MRSVRFTLQPPRHPALRFVLALAGLALLGFFAAFALVVAGGVLAVFGARRLLRRVRAGAEAPTPARAAPPGVIEGEFSVVSKHTPLLPR